MHVCAGERNAVCISSKGSSCYLNVDRQQSVYRLPPAAHSVYSLPYLMFYIKVKFHKISAGVKALIF